MLKLLKNDIRKMNFLIMLGLNIIILLVGRDNLEFSLTFIAPLFFTTSSLMSSMFGDLTFNYDRFICSLPITRKEFVLSKYVFAVLILFVTTLINIVLLILSKYFGLIEYISFESLKLLIITAFLMLTFLFAVFFVVKNTKIMAWLNIIIYVVILLSSSVITFIKNEINKLLNIDLENLMSSSVFTYVSIALTVIIYVLSYYFIAKNYEKKDI
jgi:ABC-2 type transport system permease protein